MMSATTGSFRGSRVPAVAARNDVRLALVSAGELFGGVERQLLDLCQYARHRRSTCPSLLLFHDLELASRARSVGIEPTILSARHRYALSPVRELARYVSAQGINVVHAHGYKAIVACALAGSMSGETFEVVKTEHGRPEPMQFGIGWVKSRLNHYLGLLATRHCAGTVSYVTRDLADQYAAAHGRLRRTVIHNGIDPLEPASFRRPGELDTGRVELGVVGRVTEVKGISFALRALASPMMPAAVRLNVIGSGPSEDALRREASDLRLGHRVRFLGFRRNVLDFIAHLDGLLMPSLHEGLPYTLLEAMSLGVPIIASRVGGLAEVLRDGENALLVPAADVQALEAAVERIAVDVSFARSLGDSAAKLQRRDYTLDQMGQRYWQTYESCLPPREALLS